MKKHLKFMSSGRRVVLRFTASATSLIRKLKRHATRRRLLIGGGTLAALITLTYTIGFYAPRSTTFSYSMDNCLTNPVIFPGLVTPKHSQTFKATLRKSIDLAGLPVYSHTTCISPSRIPDEKESETIALRVAGTNFLRKTISIKPGKLPSINRQADHDAPVPTTQPLVFVFDQADRIFDYQLLANKKSVDCAKQDRILSCDVNGLGLKQTKKYSFALHRKFHGATDEVAFEKELTTVAEVRIVKASVQPGQTVYNVPKSVDLTLNRPIESIDGAKIYRLDGKKRHELPVSPRIKGKAIQLALDKPLPRSSQLEIRIDGATAADKGFLNKPFIRRFHTSGGPKVMGVNTGGAKLPPSGSITLTFDSTPSAKQPISKFIQLFSGNSLATTSVVTSGQTITITPSGGLPKCSGYTIKVLDGLQNEHGVSGGSAWQQSGQVLCQTVFGIGRSVLGRGITAYSFGSGGSSILFVGGTHGDESSSTYLMNSWVGYLEANAHRLPAGKKIVVIPDINPDGSAAARRTNAHNVDLNRNFPANDWKKNVTMPGGYVQPSGGGSAPLSEPESKALANYTSSLSPKLVLTYHATGGVVVANNSGNSQGLAGIYDQQSNVYQISKSASKSFFDYDTTGAYEDWLYDKVGIPCLLIELWTKSGYEFDSHVNAMWSMIQ